MRRTAALLIGLVLASGCEGRAEPVQIVVPERAFEIAAFGPAEALPACPPGEARVERGCQSVWTAYTSPGGRTFSVDGRTGDDAADGSAERPWRTLSRAAGRLLPGDAVVIRAGTYRETLAPRVGGSGADARVTFAAYPGEAVVISGADRADSGWTLAPLSNGRRGWRRAWGGEDVRPYAEGDWHFRRPLVVARGHVLRPVRTLDDLTPGTFTVEGPDDAPTALVARFDGDAAPSAAGPLEVAVRTYGIRPEGADPYAACGSTETPGWFRFVGLTVRHTTNRAQWGAVCAGSRGSLVEEVAAEWTSGAGVDASGQRHVFQRVRADHNGQIGWVGGCTDCLIEDSQAVGNNWKGHDPFWEAGGGKWHATRGTTIRRHYAAGNVGPGIWLDGDNADNTIEGCRVEGNTMAGIMLELNTTRTLVQHNLVSGTRRLAWTGTGILSQAASGNVYAFNTVVGSEGTGLWLRLDPDRRAPDGGNVVANNWIVGNATRPEEAREVSVEVETAAEVRSTRFAGNTYGVMRGDPLWRSAFYAAPHGPSGLRTNRLAEWQDVVRGDAGATTAAGWPDRRQASPVPAAPAGAEGAGIQASRAVGADPRLVRSERR
ncbi:MAG TPA: right-handed parallel beta-helix repeat-containing protein [Rubricoccaceae bacterium]|jgi:parallel beta-helix repeat protein